MGFESIFVFGVILLCLVLLIFTKISTDVVFVGGLTLIIVFGVIPVNEALVGFSNEGMLTVAALYVVAAGLRETGAIQYVIQNLLGHPDAMWKTQARIIAPVMGMSAFLNNTPIVASFIPALQEWARKYRVQVSKIMIPLSYAAILGGTCTLIGTSTNLIVNGLLISEKGISLNIFEPAYVGIPIAAAGFLYLLTLGNRLLPNRSSAVNTFENTREYTIEMMVSKESPLTGKGPFTGEVSPAMLKDRNCRYVIVGHSERRSSFNESFDIIKDKIKASLKEKLVPILCIIEEEESGALESIRKQLLEILEEEFLKEIMIAYEPVYAIGTGNYCSIEEAEKKKVFIKSVLAKNYKKTKNVPILYGGSVDSKNAEDYIKKGGFDGLLVGTASLKKSEFKKIIERVT